MIDKACGVFRRIAINGIALVSSKDIDVACGEAPVTFLLGHFLSDVAENLGALLDLLRSKQSLASNA